MEMALRGNLLELCKLRWRKLTVVHTLSLNLVTIVVSPFGFLVHGYVGIVKLYF